MTRFLLGFILCLAAQFCFAQAEVNSYQNNTVTNSFYTPLVGATDITNGDIWDDEEYMLTMPAGSNFTFAGTPITEVTVESNGLVLLNSDFNLMLVPYFADLIDRADFTTDSLGSSPILFEIAGAAGSQVMTVEWANAGFFSGDSLDYVNFQVKLFETTEIVEFHYGTSSVVSISDAFDGESGPAVGIVSYNDITEEITGGTSLIGDPNFPSYIQPQPVDLTFLTGLPTDGLMYDWTVIPASSQQTPYEIQSMTVSPTIVDGNIVTLNIDLAQSLEATLVISNQLGQIISSEQVSLEAGTQIFEISTLGLAAGTYQVSIIDSGASLSSRFIILD